MDMTLKVKICGLTTIADMRLAERLGADYVGMVVEVGHSPRAISRYIAYYLCRAATAESVVVVADLAAPQISEIANVCRPAAVQVHNTGHLALVQQLRRLLSDDVELWLALGLPPAGEDTQARVAEMVGQIKQYADCGVARIVLDTSVQGRTGGTGVPGDWPTAAQVVQQSPLPVMLAGGLTPDNVAEAISQVRPAGVDISSGVESQPGRKDPAKLHQLVQALASATFS